MLPTEVQRILLLIGLAATGYLAILAWNEDYVQHGPTPDYAPAPAPLAQEMPGEFDPNSTAVPLESDVPDSSLIGPTRTAARETLPSVPAGGSEPGRLIQVNTPTLKVWIDRLGGDVVRVELPKFPREIDRPDVPYLLLDNGSDHIYIAQSGLIGADGVDAGGARPLYRSDAAEYDVEAGQNVTVVLNAEVDGLSIRKTYRFAGDLYLIDVGYSVHNDRDMPINASLFAQIKRDAREPYGQTSFSLGPRPYLGAAVTTDESRYEKLTFDDLDEDTFRAVEQGGWIAFLQHYFLSAWVADPEQTNNYYGRKRPDGTYIVGYTGPLQSVAPGADGTWNAQLYAGPKNQKRLEKIAPNLNLTVDYGFLWWIAVPLFYVLDWLHGISGNWGAAIVLLTVLVKLILFPLSAASYRSMANMRRVGPQMKRLQERHADDRQKLSQEMMALYKKEKVNPLGGCLPMLLPMPIFIALYWVLYESVELRHAPLALWINDLSAMDPFFVLPLLMGASMYLQQLMSPAMGDPMQVRMMRLMPVMFTVLFLFFPSGLVLYWLVNNVLSMAQQWFVIRQTEQAHAAKG